MICKFCGAEVHDGRCTQCGGVAVLTNRSYDLDRLMSKKVEYSEEKTYQQGLVEGYQNGLDEGYKKAIEMGNGKEVSVPKPSKRKMFIIICTAIIICALVGVGSSMMNYKRGYLQGKEVGHEEGLEEGIQQNAQEFESEKVTIYQSGYEEGYDEGFSAGNDQAITVQDEMTESVEIKTRRLYPIVENNRRVKHLRGVEIIQEILNVLFDPDIDVDGEYGPATQNSIKRFQKAISELFSIEMEISGETDMQTLVYLFYALDHSEEFTSRYNMLLPDDQTSDDTNTEESTLKDEEVEGLSTVEPIFEESKDVTVMPDPTILDKPLPTPSDMPEANQSNLFSSQSTSESSSSQDNLTIVTVQPKKYE